MAHVFRSVTRICGIALYVLGLAMILSFVVSLICGEWQGDLPFLWTGLIVILAGICSRFFCKSRPGKLHIGDGFLIVLILWIIMSAIGALPYIITGVISDPSSAFFESCSGFTTTGATTLHHINHLSHGILFWRSMTGWLGGIAILLIAITLMPALGLNGQRLNTPDNYGPVLEQVSPRMIDSIRTIILIYTGLTLLETNLLTISGMTPFNGLIHSMSTVSTCGFSRYDNSIAHFEGCGIPLIMSAFMIISGLNYHLFLRRPRNGIYAFMHNSEVRLYAVLLTSSFLLIAASRSVARGQITGRAVSDALFESASFLSTTGFLSADYGRWPELAQMLLLLLMLCGACTASAGGGLKVARISILLKLVRHGVSARLHTKFFETVRMNGQGMTADAVSSVAVMPFLFLSALFSGAFLLTFGGVSLSTAFNASAACLCNVGHAFGALGLSGTFAEFDWLSKCLLSLLMIGGRLELYAIVILLTPRYWMREH